MDEDMKLNTEMISKLIKICPNSEENVIIKEFVQNDGSIVDITNPIDALVFSMSQVPDLMLRLKCL